MARIEVSNRIEGSTATFMQMAATRVFTEAEILLLNATPIEIVPAPGAGHGLIVEGLIIEREAGAIYTGGGNVHVEYETNTGGLVSVVTSNALRAAAGLFRASPAVASHLIRLNQGLQITTSNVQAAGDGSMTVTVLYRVHEEV